MDIPQNRCMGCMNELNSDGSCSYCNYTADSPYLKSYLPPKTVLDDRYLLGKVLAYNGEGVSYIAYDLVSNTKVVVHEYMPDKLCARQTSGTKILVKSNSLEKYKTYMGKYVELHKSLSRMKTLTHIVPAISLFSGNNTIYSVTEYIEGISLKKFLAGNGEKLTWQQIRKLFTPIFTTLSIIHNAGIVHGGICPENILVTPNGEIKIVGFSINDVRKYQADLTPTLHTGYAAPEQYEAGGYIGTWSDVYSLAALIYKMLTGIVPPNGQQRKESDNIVSLLQMPTTAPQNVCSVIMQALNVDYKSRIQTITELVTMIFEQPPEYVEHTKGATQTIHVDTEKPSSNIVYSKIDEYEDGEPHYPDNMNESTESANVDKKTTIIGIVVLAVAVLVALFFLFQLFSTGEESSSTAPLSVTSETVVSNDSSKETTTSTTSTTESKYGVGSIMPNLVGYDYNSVIDSIDNDFTIEKKEKNSKKYEAGVIIKQSIPKDSDYDPARKNKLVLTVSLGSADAQTTTDTTAETEALTEEETTASTYNDDNTVSIPDYSNVPADEYGTTLAYLGITYTLKYIDSDSVKSGYVIATSTGVGQSFNTKNDTLTVSVAS